MSKERKTLEGRILNVSAKFNQYSFSKLMNRFNQYHLAINLTRESGLEYLYRVTGDHFTVGIKECDLPSKVDLTPIYSLIRIELEDKNIVTYVKQHRIGFDEETYMRKFACSLENAEIIRVQVDPNQHTVLGDTNQKSYPKVYFAREPFEILKEKNSDLMIIEGRVVGAIQSSNSLYTIKELKRELGTKNFSQLNIQRYSQQGVCYNQKRCLVFIIEFKLKTAKGIISLQKKIYDSKGNSGNDQQKSFSKQIVKSPYIQCKIKTNKDNSIELEGGVINKYRSGRQLKLGGNVLSLTQSKIAPLTPLLCDGYSEKEIGDSDVVYSINFNLIVPDEKRLFHLVFRKFTESLDTQAKTLVECLKNSLIAADQIEVDVEENFDADPNGLYFVKGPFHILSKKIFRSKAVKIYSSISESLEKIILSKSTNLSKTIDVTSKEAQVGKGYSERDDRLEIEAESSDSSEDNDEEGDGESGDDEECDEEEECEGDEEDEENDEEDEEGEGDDGEEESDEWNGNKDEYEENNSIDDLVNENEQEVSISTLDDNELIQHYNSTGSEDAAMEIKIRAGNSSDLYAKVFNEVKAGDALWHWADSFLTSDDLD